MEYKNDSNQSPYPTGNNQSSSQAFPNQAPYRPYQPFPNQVPPQRQYQQQYLPVFPQCRNQIKVQTACLDSNYTGSAIVRTLMSWLVVIVSAITLSLALPAMLCWKERYECSHTYIDGRQLHFDGKGIQLIGKLICWVLLTIITIGIYSFWLTVKVKKLKIKHTHFLSSYSNPNVAANAGNVNNPKKRISLEDKIASMPPQERAKYVEKLKKRRKKALPLGIVSVVLMSSAMICFIGALASESIFAFDLLYDLFLITFLAGLPISIVSTVYGAQSREKVGLRLGVIAISLTSIYWSAVLVELLTILIVVNKPISSYLVIVATAAAAMAIIIILIINISIFIKTRTYEKRGQSFLDKPQS